MKQTAIQLLNKNMRSSLLCCGLDPDLHKLPHLPGKTNEEKVLNFLKKVIDVTNENVCAYKIQKAFFDILPGGHKVLKETIAYIHSRPNKVPAFVDCKTGDIENTMQAYLDNIFGELNADGILVNPYLGDDVLKPMEAYPDKAVIVLAKTSNPGGAIIQDVKVKGIPLWQYVLRLVINRWNKKGNMIPVISSTAGLDLSKVRKMIPDDMPILFAGVGAQGGTQKDLSKLLNSDKSGVFVNSSRGILYAKPVKGQSWHEAVRLAALNLKDALNIERKRSKFLLLSGPSGAGKTHIINELKKMDKRFTYINPYITRPLRKGENDKVSISNAKMNAMDKKGEFLIINNIYGVRYATPITPIRKAFDEGKFPILDWPIHKMDIMMKNFPGRLVTVYVAPPSIKVLQERLDKEKRDPEGVRMAVAKEELTKYKSGKFDKYLHYKIINPDGKLSEVSKKIYSLYLAS